MDNKMILFFPIDKNKDKALAYANEYYRNAKVNGVPLFVIAQNDLTALKQNACKPMPEMHDNTASILKFPPEIQRLLKTKQKLALRNWRNSLPLLEGEKIVSEQVGFTSEPWGGLPADIFIYHRVTEKGELAVLVTGSKINPVTGEVETEVINPVETTIKQPTLSESILAHPGQPSDDVEAGDIVQTGLEIISWVGFLFGPVGAIISVGAGVLDCLFKLLFPQEAKPLDLAKEFRIIVQDEAAKKHIQTQIPKVMTYIKWLAANQISAISGGFKKPEHYEEVKEILDKKEKGEKLTEKEKTILKNHKESTNTYEETLKDIKKFIVDACSPNSALLQAVSQLEGDVLKSEPLYHILALPAYVLATSTHLMFEKTRMLLSTDATTYKSPLTYYLVSTADSYGRYIRQTIKDIQRTMEERIAAVSPVFKRCMPDVFSGTIDTLYFVVEDYKLECYPQGTEVYPTTLSRLPANKCVWYSICGRRSGGFIEDRASGEKFRADYLERINTLLPEYYMYKEKQQVQYANVIGQYSGFIGKFGPLIDLDCHYLTDWPEALHDKQITVIGYYYECNDQHHTRCLCSSMAEEKEDFVDTINGENIIRKWQRPDSPQVWFNGELSEEVRKELTEQKVSCEFRQQNPPKTWREHCSSYYGRVKVTGTFWHGKVMGKGVLYEYQMNVQRVKVIGNT